MLNIKNILIFIILIGIIIIIIDSTKKYTFEQCPKSEIKYIYVPRSFNLEQDNPLFIREIFGGLFNDASTWLGSTSNTLSNMKKI